MSDRLLTFNGINGATGGYGLPPMTGRELASFIRGEGKPANLNELRFRYDRSRQKTYGVKEGVDPKKLGEAGWGVIFANDADPAVKEALGDLISLRKEQAGDHFRLYEAGEGYRRGKDTKPGFLARHGAGPGPADPDRVPYYLLIVGSPDDIPYQFQYELDVQYAVGRLHFDTLDEYSNYAAGVLVAERGSVRLPRRAAFFATANPGDQATQLSAGELIEPLAASLKSAGQGWQVSSVTRDAALKVRLGSLLGGPETPALLVAATHGMEFPLGDPRQVPHQGALLCQDWPGAAGWGGKSIPQDFYLAGDDLSRDANLLGLVAFFFACYGAGTPLLDEFSKQAFQDRMPIAAAPFLAGLPKKMLGHPGGAALAVVGHVERAWTFSFDWPGAGPQRAVFESTLRRLLDGHPVGSALEYFNMRWAELATVLNGMLEDIEFGKQYDPYDLVDLWTANNDARGYAIVGDPAVRLPVAAAGEEARERPAITLGTPPMASPAAAPAAAAASEASAPAAPAAASLGVPDDHLYSNGVRYDLMWPGGPDLSFWLAQAQRYGGPVLELACGTGRVSIPLAQAGFQVTGIDLSEGMLAAARAKAAAAGVDVAWVHGDVRDFDLGRRFRLIIFPANALCHLLTVEDFERMAACVVRHLEPGGRFIPSVFVPDFQILSRDPAEAYLFAEYTRPEDGETVHVWHRHLYRPDTQVNRISLFRKGPAGAEVPAGEIGMRMYFPQELDALLRYNGLPVERKYGDYDGRPFAADSTQQIPVCTRVQE